MTRRRVHRKSVERIHHRLPLHPPIRKTHNELTYFWALVPTNAHPYLICGHGDPSRLFRSLVPDHRNASRTVPYYSFHWIARSRC
ncbi:hypothetical protein VTK26DRAFT_8454 [Humicola hyalothermophila]